MEKACNGCNHGTPDQVELLDAQEVDGTWCDKKSIFIAVQHGQETAHDCRSFIKLQAIRPTDSPAPKRSHQRRK